MIYSAHHIGDTRSLFYNQAYMSEGTTNSFQQKIDRLNSKDNPYGTLGSKEKSLGSVRERVLRMDVKDDEQRLMPPEKPGRLARFIGRIRNRGEKTEATNSRESTQDRLDNEIATGGH